MDPFEDLGIDMDAVVAAAAAARAGNGQVCGIGDTRDELEIRRGRPSSFDLLCLPLPPIPKTPRQPRQQRDRPEAGEDDPAPPPPKKNRAEKRRAFEKGPSSALALLAAAAPALTSEAGGWGWNVDDPAEGEEAGEAELDFRGWKGVEAGTGADGRDAVVALDLAGVSRPSSCSPSTLSCFPPPGVMPALLPTLVRLSLGGNSLSSLPEDFGGGEGEGGGKDDGDERKRKDDEEKEKNASAPPPPSALEWLWLENNQFRDLPRQLSSPSIARTLKHLSLALNPLSGKLGPLRVLASLKNLETLDLSECALEEIPDEIGELTLLTRLDLHSNRISRIPEQAIGELKRLARLSLHSNELSGPFPSRALLGCSSLEWLSLNSNRLTEIPEGALSGCPRLSRLSLHLNELGPSVAADLADALPRLEALSLFGNGIETLPDSIFKPENLQKLARLPLWDNRLKELPRKWFRGLTGLQELWLSRNELTSLEFSDGDDDDGDKTVLPSLARLWIDGNGGLDAERTIRDAARACPGLQEVHADCGECGGGGGESGGGRGNGGACTRRRSDGWRCASASSSAAKG